MGDSSSSEEDEELSDDGSDSEGSSKKKTKKDNKKKKSVKVDRTMLKSPKFGGTATKQFNTLRAMVSITRRIFDTRLLPPHSRTLNHSLLKSILENTAMFSNREVRHYYKEFKQSDARTEELAMVSDAQLRKLKADVMEYVDRKVSVRDFLESEMQGEPFAAAFNECLHYIVAKTEESAKQGSAASPSQRDIAKKVGVLSAYSYNQPPDFAWDAEKLAYVITRFGDIRGNIDDVDQANLLDRYHWYSTHQHSWGVFQSVYTLSMEIELQVGKDTDFSKVDVSLMNKVLQKYLTISGSNPKHPSQAPEGDAPTQLEGAATKETKKEAWSKLSKLTGWDLQKKVMDALHLLKDIPTTDEALTLFDIALLGGLHPRTYFIEKTARHQRSIQPDDLKSLQNPPTKLTTKQNEPDTRFVFDNEQQLTISYNIHAFFETCLEYCNRQEQEDLGAVIHHTRLGKKGSHTSYLAFQEPSLGAAAAAAAVRASAASAVATAARAAAATAAAAGAGTSGEPFFGAPKRDAPAASALNDQANKRRLAEISKRQSAGMDLYDLENYCDACLERGAALYYRLVHTMIEAPLLDLRNEKMDVPFYRAFSKFIGLTIQRGEIMNPRLKSNVANMREQRRNTNLALAEVRYQLATICGFVPDVEFLD